MRERSRKLWGYVLFAAAIGVALLVVLRLFGRSSGDEVSLRDRPGAQPVYLERTVAQQALAVSKRAGELLLREGEGSRVEGTALFKIGNEDWLAACALLRANEPALRTAALDGQAGARPASALEKLRLAAPEVERLRARFAAVEMLQRGRVPEELRAFLDDLARLIAALPAEPAR
ncbi:MAG: hypothetical protein IPN34_22250 [Planctomycetes bacterium]|nr:hypothetical protein [Planctomycetota bacterium]